MQTYSRVSPSPRYAELLTLYRDMHENGERFQNTAPDQTFAGQSLPRQAGRIKELVDHHGARTILDYGSGKGRQYDRRPVKVSDGRRFDSIGDFWGVQKVTCYDPGYLPFADLPQGRFDGVICTDVLEHCPEQDLPWILEELFGYAEKFVFANVACYPASKRLANGENAHCTIKPEDWWRNLLADVSAQHPEVHYYFALELLTGDGQPDFKEVLLKG